MEVGLLFFALSLLFLISCETRATMYQSSKTNDLVHDLCNRTSNYNECVSTIKSDPRSDLKTTPKGSLRILYERALANATTTRTLIADLREKAKDNVTIECLNLCYSNYDTGIDNLNDSLGLIDDFAKDYNRYTNLNMVVGDFGVEVDTCEDTWNEKPVRKSPLTAINNYLFAICGIMLDITSIIYCDHKELCATYAP